jgi:hypothetical protein
VLPTDRALQLILALCSPCYTDAVRLMEEEIDRHEIACQAAGCPPFSAPAANNAINDFSAASNPNSGPSLGPTINEPTNTGYHSEAAPAIHSTHGPFPQVLQKYLRRGMTDENISNINLYELFDRVRRSRGRMLPSDRLARSLRLDWAVEQRRAMAPPPPVYERPMTVEYVLANDFACTLLMVELAFVAAWVDEFAVRAHRVMGLLEDAAAAGHQQLRLQWWAVSDGLERDLRTADTQLQDLSMIEDDYDEQWPTWEDELLEATRAGRVVMNAEMHREAWDATGAEIARLMEVLEKWPERLRRMKDDVMMALSGHESE